MTKKYESNLYPPGKFEFVPQSLHFKSEVRHLLRRRGEALPGWKRIHHFYLKTKKATQMIKTTNRTIKTEKLETKIRKRKTHSQI